MDTDSLRCEHDRQRLVFSGKVIVQKRTGLKISLKRVGKVLVFSFREVGAVVFADIFVTTFTQCPETVQRHAAHHLAYLFWGQQVCHQFMEANIAYNQGIFQDAAYTIAERLHETHWLVPGLVMEIDQILPETTERNDWLGVRQKVLRPWPNDAKVDFRPPKK